MVTTVTRASWRSLSLSASSSAFRSSGLNTAGSAARLMVPSSFMASPVTLAVSGTCLTRTTMRSCGMSGVQGRGIGSDSDLVHEAGRLPDGPRARTFCSGGEALPCRGNAARVDRPKAPCDNRRMTRGRHHIVRTLAVLGALACALLGASARAAGGRERGRQLRTLTAGGPVRPAPPVLDDLMGRGAGAAALDLPLGLGALPGARETAAFAAGRVAVGVVFLESDGSRMTSTENWSRQDPATRAGPPRSSSPRSRTRSTGGTRARRTARSSSSCRRRAPTARRRPSRPATSRSAWPSSTAGTATAVLSDAAWRWQAMGKLGFGHDARDDTPLPETLYADRIRRAERRRLGLRPLRGRQPARTRTACSATASSPTRPTSSARTPCSPTTTTATASPTSTPCSRTRWATSSARSTSTRRRAPGYPSTGDLTSGYLGVRNRNAVQRRHDRPAVHHARVERDAAAPSRAATCARRRSGRPGCATATATRGRTWWTRGRRSRPGSSRRPRDGAVTLRGTVAERPRRRGRISGGVYFRHDLSIMVPHDVQLSRGRRRLAAADGGRRRLRRGRPRAGR